MGQSKQGPVEITPWRPSLQQVVKKVVNLLPTGSKNLSCGKDASPTPCDEDGQARGPPQRLLQLLPHGVDDVLRGLQDAGVHVAPQGGGELVRYGTAHEVRHEVRMADGASDADHEVAGLPVNGEIVGMSKGLAAPVDEQHIGLGHTCELGDGLTERLRWQSICVDGGGSGGRGNWGPMKKYEQSIRVVEGSEP